MPLTHTLCHRSSPEHSPPQACFWDGDKLEQRKSFSQDWKVESASFCPGRGRFVVGGEDMYAHLYEYDTGNELECNRGAQPAQHSVPNRAQDQGSVEPARVLWPAACRGRMRVTALIIAQLSCQPAS